MFSNFIHLKLNHKNVEMKGIQHYGQKTLEIEWYFSHLTYYSEKDQRLPFSPAVLLFSFPFISLQC